MSGRSIPITSCVKKETPRSLENPGGGNESFEHHIDTTEKFNFFNQFHHPAISTMLGGIFTVRTNSTIPDSRVNHDYYIGSGLQ